MFKLFLSLFHAPVFPTHTLPLSLPFLLLYMCHAELCLDDLQYNVPFLPLGKCCHSRSSLLSPTFSDGHSRHQMRCTLMNGRKGKSCSHTSTTGHIWQEIYRGAQFNIHDLILSLEPTFAWQASTLWHVSAQQPASLHGCLVVRTQNSLDTFDRVCDFSSFLCIPPRPSSAYFQQSKKETLWPSSW